MTIEDTKSLTSAEKVDSIPEEPETTQDKSTNQMRKDRNKAMKRVPLRHQISLDFEMEDGYHYREVIDRADRIDRYLKAGYTLVEKPDGTKEGRSKDPSNLGKYRSRIVGVGKDGRVERAYIMRIKQEWYDADQEAKMADLKRKMRSAQHVKGVPAKQAYGQVVINDTLE